MIIFVHSFLPVGGAETLRKTVVKEFLKKNVQFRICLIKGGGEIASELNSFGINIDILGRSNSIYNPFTTVALALYFLRNRPEIVHSSQFNSNFHTRIAARIARVPVVICEEHGLYFWKDWWHRLLDRLLVHWCDKTIAVSEAVKKFNIENIGIPSEKIKVLHNCIDTDMFQSIKQSNFSSIRSELGLLESDFVFGHIGTMRHEKNHDILLKAFADMKKKYPCKLLLIGDGPLHKEIVKLTKRLGIAADVIFTGIRNDIPSILKALDVFVFPSRNEALGIALLEAMFVGLPVIGTNVGGIPEIISDRETGLLVPNEDCGCLSNAMLELYENATLRGKLGRAAQQYVTENHDPAAYADQMLTMYDEILREKGSR